MTGYGDLLTRNEKTSTSSLASTSLQTCEYPALQANGISADFSLKHYIIGEPRNVLKIDVNENLILMQFCIRGAYTFKSEEQKKSVSFKCSKCNILFVPTGQIQISCSPTELELVTIYVRRDFFVKNLQMGIVANENPLVENFGTFFPKNISITPKIKSILNEINECRFDAHLKNLYLKAKIIELLTLQLVQHEEEKAPPSVLKPLEIEKMFLVKEFIENNLNESHSITSLAKKAGTNEQYLKKHFKIVFGNTVFGYLLSCKMQKAKEMLLTKKYKITEIAETVGYKHATHFTSAFKKFFGCLPQSFKTKVFLGGYFSLTIKFEVLRMLMSV